MTQRSGVGSAAKASPERIHPERKRNHRQDDSADNGVPGVDRVGGDADEEQHPKDRHRNEQYDADDLGERTTPERRLLVRHRCGIGWVMRASSGRFWREVRLVKVLGGRRCLLFHVRWVSGGRSRPRGVEGLFGLPDQVVGTRLISITHDSTVATAPPGLLPPTGSAVLG